VFSHFTGLHFGKIKDMCYFLRIRSKFRDFHIKISFSVQNHASVNIPSPELHIRAKSGKRAKVETLEDEEEIKFRCLSGVTGEQR
jgi:hypothetical protein